MSRYFDYEYNEVDYDKLEENFCGDTETVAYARYLMNRGGWDAFCALIPAKYQGIAETALDEDVPGSVELNRVEEFLAAKEKREESDTQKRLFLYDFRDYSRKFKLRMSKMKDLLKMRVLKNLLDAEEANIAAKNCYRDYIAANYERKRRFLKQAIADLPQTGWPYWYHKTNDGFTAYIFYVELPGGLQVSWHGTDIADMKGVCENKSRKWDGVVGVTLERIVECVQTLCPSIMEDKFNRTKCANEFAKVA